MFPFFKKSAALAVLVCFLLVPLATLARAQAEAGKAKVNINSAGLNELQSLPRVGPKLAQRILDFRKENGPFKRPEDLLKVKGIGEKMFRSFKDLVTVGAEPQAK
jgi:competence protein ComEA